jgi:hypothetical protein
MEKYVEMQLVFAMILLKNMLKCNLFLPWYCWKICWNATCSCYIVEKYVKMQLVLTMILLKNMLKCVKMQLVLTMILLKNMLKCNLFLPWYCWKIYWNATCSHHDIVEKYVEMQLVLAYVRQNYRICHCVNKIEKCLTSLIMCYTLHCIRSMSITCHRRKSDMRK